jgi:hypothetical protein
MPRAKTPKPTLSKSDFVRSQPSTLSGAEVLAKAKEAGIKLTPQLVYKVRSDAKPNGKAKTSRAARKTAVTTKPSAAAKPPKSKAAFVRGLSAGTPAKDVVKQAKALVSPSASTTSTISAAQPRWRPRRSGQPQRAR